SASLVNAYAPQRQALALGFLTSAEYRNIVVNGLYRKYLGRPAGAAEQAFYTDAIANGMTVEGVAQALLASDEYFQRQGGTPLSFLQAIYLDVLGRQITQAEQQNWMAQFNSNPNSQAVRAQVANTLLT